MILTDLLFIFDWFLHRIFMLPFFPVLIPEFFQIFLIKTVVCLKIYLIGFFCCLKQFFLWRNLPLTSTTLPNFDNDRQPLAIITGGTCGIGLALCERLASNWKLIIIGRDRRRGHSAIEHLKRIYGSRCKAIFYFVDLSSRKSINEFLEIFIKFSLPFLHFTQTFDRLHLLVNNAGLMMIPYQAVGHSGDIELQWAVNFLAPVYLADRLRPCLERALRQDGFARIVNVSSLALYAASLSPEYFACAGGCNGTPERYSSHLAYANSKLALSLFTELQANRYGDKKLITCSIHPGVVATNLYRHTNIFMRLLVSGFIPFVSGRFILTPDQAAKDLLWACFSSDIEQGAFYENGSRLPLPNVDDQLSEVLWRHLERQDIVSKIK